MDQVVASRRRRGRRRLAQPLVEIPIKLKLRGGRHDDVIEFFQSIPSGCRASTIVAITRAFLSGQMPGPLPGLAQAIQQADEDEIYAALKEML